MSTFICSQCHQVKFGGHHQCPPAWLARDEDETDDSWISVFAADEESAACAYLEQSNAAYGSCDYATRRTVLVKRTPEDDPQAYDVEMELVPSYSATRRWEAP